jgi:predicted nucleic acid-binding protein
VTAASAVDTSVLVAASIREHAAHATATGPSRTATHALGPVLAETWSVLRRAYRLDAATVAAVMAAYVASRELVVPSAAVYRAVLAEGRRGASPATFTTRSSSQPVSSTD